MESINQRRSIYKMAASEVNERDLRKFRSETNDYSCKYEDDFIELTKKLPNWKSYLTEKQLRISELYIGCRNTNAIDIQLKLTPGAAYHTLYGSKGVNIQIGGVLKKLKDAYAIYQRVNEKKGGNKNKCRTFPVKI